MQSRLDHVKEACCAMIEDFDNSISTIRYLPLKGAGDSIYYFGVFQLPPTFDVFCHWPIPIN